MTPTAKPAWLSKTLIVNGVAIAAGALAAALDSAGVLHLGASTVVYGTIALAAINAGLRLATNTAIAGTPAARSILAWPATPPAAPPTTAPPAPKAAA